MKAVLTNPNPLSRPAGDSDIRWLVGEMHRFPGVGEKAVSTVLAKAASYKYFHRFWLGSFRPIVIVYHPDTVYMLTI